MSGRAGFRRALRHRVEYVFLRIVAAVCAVLPAGLADRTGAALGWVVARVGRPRWQVVSEHLRHAFPERDDRWRLKVARRCYMHFAAEAVAVFRMAGMSAGAVRKCTTVVGIELLEAAAREGRGVIVVSGHLGNWEIGGAAVVARGRPMDIVVARQRNELFDRYLTHSRQRLGFGLIPRGAARHGVLKSLREGRAVGIMGDQDARAAGVFADFFGRPASTARGPAVLAMRSGAEVVTLFSIRLPGWKPRYRVHIERLPAARGDRGSEGITALTQAFTTRIEERVREFPCQYLWLHRRWKTEPSQTPGRQQATTPATGPSHSV